MHGCGRDVRAGGCVSRERSAVSEAVFWICSMRLSSPHHIDNEGFPSYWSSALVRVAVQGKCQTGDLLTGTAELARICKAGEPLVFSAWKPESDVLREQRREVP